MHKPTLKENQMPTRKIKVKHKSTIKTNTKVNHKNKTNIKIKTNTKTNHKNKTNIKTNYKIYFNKLYR